MSLLALDLGTTYCKAGLFHRDGQLQAVSSLPSPIHRTQGGFSYFDPEEFWQVILSILRDVLSGQAVRLDALGITSMAETGLILDKKSGEARSPLLPWFDRSADKQANDLVERGLRSDEEERFLRTGIHPTFKCGLAKMLWLQDGQQDILQDGIWLSAPDYIAYRLTGHFGTDHSLAGRTCAYRIDTHEWDEEWLAEYGLTGAHFPQTFPSGKILAGVSSCGAEQSGLPADLPVAIAGHDHVCASFGLGMALAHLNPYQVFDSMGTAESLLGVLPAQNGFPLDREAFRSGLSFGCYVLPDHYYWMGGLSSSGGSVEWLRSLLGEEKATYEEMESWLKEKENEPSGILFYPYLAGSGSPHTDPGARAALLGLHFGHGKADILRAILEGTAYEMEYIRSAAQASFGISGEQILAMGGGTRNSSWLQIKADVSGIPVLVPEVPQAALLGAALLAGLHAGVYENLSDLQESLERPAAQLYQPDKNRHEAYRSIYQVGYLAFLETLKGVRGLYRDRTHSL